jgi:hypothetical protein
VSFSQANVSEIWWAAYHDCLRELDVDFPSPPSTIEEILIAGGGHALAARGADVLTKKRVTTDEWRAFRDDQADMKPRPGRLGTMQRQVGAPPKRQRRQPTKRDRNAA